MIDEVVVTNKTELSNSKYTAINSKTVIDSNFKQCVPLGFKVTEMKGFKNQIAGDYDGDGIFEISSIVRKNDVVKLTITQRDTFGNCTKQFTTGNLTTNLLNNKQNWQLMNTMTTRFGGPKGTTENVVFSYKSILYDIKLTFYGDQKTNNFYLFHFQYIIHENNKIKDGQIIVQDFLKQEKKTMSKTGSRDNIKIEKIPMKKYTLSTLDFKTIMDLVK